MAALVSLLHEDASMSMPPFALWLRGAQDMIGLYTGFGSACAGSKLVPLTLNAQPAFAQYKPEADGGYSAWCLQVLEISAGRIAHIHHFPGDEIFVQHGLPTRLP